LKESQNHWNTSMLDFGQEELMMNID
jgi:hypothetical protein